MRIASLALVVAAACSQPDPPAPTRDPPPPSPAKAAAPATESVPATPVGLSGNWVGTYSYPDDPGTRPREPVRFFVELREDAGTLTGTILEPNTFAEAGAKELRAKLSGRREGSGTIRFGKTYDGASGPDHTVEYTGTLDAAGNRIDGTWRVGAASGIFGMHRWGS